MLGHFDTPFLILVLTLLGIGLVTLFSSSYASSLYYLGNSYYYILRQLFFAVVGVAAMLAASLVNYRFLRNFSWLAYGVSLILMAACYLFPAQQGAQRWIQLGPLSFQPSEIAKFSVILLFAHLMDRDKDKMGRMIEGTWRYIVLYGAVAVILIFQPHLSGTLLIGFIALTMMLVGGTKFSNLLKIGVPLLVLLLVVAFLLQDFILEQFAHVVTRLTYWLDPFSTTDPGSYQTRQSLLAIGSGGLWGVGFGESRQKHMYLPEVRNDFVFAIVCEELGFIGASLVIILFAMLVWRGYHIAMHARDRFGSLLVTGITTQIGLQAFLNIAVVTNLIPNTGISLPFFSYGGTALLIMLAEIGVVLAVSRQARHEKE
ncbi:MAG: putative lipid II flippase FtsW [Oscillospiraceae bacterium]|nr:putative lipid II flippase FtsW [Oscillospiraceae bacterium]